MHNDRALVRSRRARPAKSTVTLQRGIFESPRPAKRAKVVKRTPTKYSSLIMAHSKEITKDGSISPASVASMQLFTPPSSPDKSDSLTSSQSSSPSTSSVESSSKRVSFKLGTDGVSISTSEDLTCTFSSPSQTPSISTPKSILKPGRLSFPETDASTSAEDLRSQFRQAISMLDTPSVGTRLRAYTDLNEIFKTYNVLLDLPDLPRLLQNLHLACFKDLLRPKVDLSVLNESRCKTQLLKCVFTILWIDAFRPSLGASFELTVLHHCSELLVHPQSPKQLISQALHVLSSVDLGAGRLDAKDIGVLLRSLDGIPSRHMGKNIQYQRIAVFERLLGSYPTIMAASLTEWREAFFHGLLSEHFPIVILAVQVGFKILKTLGSNPKAMASIADYMLGNDDTIYTSLSEACYERCVLWLRVPGKGPLVPRLWTVITLLHVARGSTRLSKIMPAEHLKPLLSCMAMGAQNQKTRAAARRVLLVFYNTYHTALVGNIDFGNTFLDVVAELSPAWIMGNMSEVLRIIEFVAPWRMTNISTSNLDIYMSRFEDLLMRFFQAVERGLNDQAIPAMIAFGATTLDAFFKRQQEFVSASDTSACPATHASLRRLIQQSSSLFKGVIPEEKLQITSNESESQAADLQVESDMLDEKSCYRNVALVVTGAKRSRQEFEAEDDDMLDQERTDDEHDNDEDDESPPDAKRCKFSAETNTYKKEEMDLDASISTASASSPRSMLGLFRSWAYGISDGIFARWRQRQAST